MSVVTIHVVINNNLHKLFLLLIVIRLTFVVVVVVDFFNRINVIYGVVCEFCMYQSQGYTIVQYTALPDGLELALLRKEMKR
jgi:hypothetical protein